MTARLVALGDSFSCGEGVGITVPLEQTWSGLLAEALRADLRCLARPGATVAAVRRDQLPKAGGDAELATILIGLNDISRGGFNPTSFARDLLSVVAGTGSTETKVLLARLHDPCRLLPMTAGLKRWFGRRLDAVNSAIDTAAVADERVRMLDLDKLPELRERSAWAIDRLHPSPYGHTVIAAAAADLLSGVAPSSDATVAATRRLDEALWLVRHALPWTMTKSLPAGRFVVRRVLART